MCVTDVTCQQNPVVRSGRLQHSDNAHLQSTLPPPLSKAGTRPPNLVAEEEGKFSKVYEHSPRMDTYSLAEERASLHRMESPGWYGSLLKYPSYKCLLRRISFLAGGER